MTVASVVVVMSAARAAATEQYEYDALGRLVRVAYASGAIVQYSYDAAGNRSQVVSSVPTLNRETGLDPDKATTAPSDGRDPPDQVSSATKTVGAPSGPTSATTNT